MDLTLDINSELYPLREGEIITLALARSLLADAEEDDIAESVNGDGEEGGSRRKVKRELWRGGDQGIAADFEYVMYGKVSVVSILAGTLGQVEMLKTMSRRPVDEDPS